jgi:hypothetical protein
MRGTFERDRLPARSTLSRFLAALTEVPVEALRTLFLDDARSAPALERKTNQGPGESSGKYVGYS